MWDYICVFIFPRHLFGNLLFTATSVHFVQAFLMFVFLQASLLTCVMFYLPQNVFIKDLQQKTASNGAATHFCFVSVMQRKVHKYSWL